MLIAFSYKFIFFFLTGSIDCFNEAFRLNSKLKKFEITGKELNKLEGHTNAVFCLVLLPNNQLASGSEDKTIRIWI